MNLCRIECDIIEEKGAKERPAFSITMNVAQSLRCESP